MQMILRCGKEGVMLREWKGYSVAKTQAKLLKLEAIQSQATIIC